MTFTDWKQSNKHIVFSLYDLADEMRGRGHKHWSIRAAFHVIRWRTAMSEKPEGAFKLNNKWSKPLAELYNASVGYEFFRTRESCN